jgi:hypothetical protein
MRTAIFNFIGAGCDARQFPSDGAYNNSPWMRSNSAFVAPIPSGPLNRFLSFYSGVEAASD